jgi:hypothetical protein
LSAVNTVNAVSVVNAVQNPRVRRRRTLLWRCLPRRLAAATFLTALTVLTGLTALTADRIDIVDIVDGESQ